LCVVSVRVSSLGVCHLFGCVVSVFVSYLYVCRLCVRVCRLCVCVVSVCVFDFSKDKHTVSVCVVGNF
jgi:hypothetical protein